ncbi:MAG: hypothetical protein COT81_00290 [Candidatus Buchananbacteria bacterium CG10_big_fil_rev_8_21_14_0_10_42_9]|uniref:Bacterial Pleckstrin homology domain-containing protein n=1 Tax=Candidatus Buchananbacteria bacterium CG10_big_fil_rev_8_21_14_0_10_42_9 TaxID=1974526 RepID=A0A2H0W2Q6_9BACT|nr:MAG: hypothetical protein COT81_00290 [Candidatus Buchananbacteria bacterium CG10_big_fil_rev_8_21_14_0_10_42_9]
MATVIFEEKVPIHRIFSALFTLLVAGSLLAYFYPSFLGGEFNGNQGRTFLIVFATIIALIGLAFNSLRIVLTEESVSFGFSIFRKKVALQDITSIKAQKFRFRDFGGYGIRLGRHKTTGYIAHSKDGLRIETTGRNYFISSNRVQELTQLLSAAVDQAKKRGSLR